jgi:hypothetical protein
LVHAAVPFVVCVGCIVCVVVTMLATRVVVVPVTAPTAPATEGLAQRRTRVTPTPGARAESTIC